MCEIPAGTSRGSGIPGRPTCGHVALGHARGCAQVGLDRCCGGSRRRWACNFRAQHGTGTGSGLSAACCADSKRSRADGTTPMPQEWTQAIAGGARCWHWEASTIAGRALRQDKRSAHGRHQRRADTLYSVYGRGYCLLRGGSGGRGWPGSYGQGISEPSSLSLGVAGRAASAALSIGTRLVLH